MQKTKNNVIRIKKSEEIWLKTFKQKEITEKICFFLKKKQEMKTESLTKKSTIKSAKMPAAHSSENLIKKVNENVILIR